MTSIALTAAKKLPKAISKLKQALKSLQRAASMTPTVEAVPSKTLVRTGKFVREGKSEERQIRRLKAKDKAKETIEKDAKKRKRRMAIARYKSIFERSEKEAHPWRTISRTGKFARERAKELSSPDLGGLPLFAKKAVTQRSRKVSKAVGKTKPISPIGSDSYPVGYYPDLGGLHPIAIRMLKNRSSGKKGKKR